jgi:hypothetical protein
VGPEDRNDSKDPTAEHHRDVRLGSLFLGGAVVVVAVAMALRTIARAGEPVYDLPAIAVVTVCVAAAVAVCGAVGMMRTRQPAVAFSSALVTLLFLVGLLTILSIGIVLLLGAVAVVVVVGRRAAPNIDPAAVLSGVVLSVGLVPDLVVSTKPPIVECSDGGVLTNSRAWWGGSSDGSVSGSGASSADDIMSGTIAVGSHNYSYTCRDGRLVAFVQE